MEAKEKEEEEKEEEEEEQMMDLDEILRKERAREKELKDVPEPPEVTETEGDSDKLTPYKTDLEYLDDHFQVITKMLIIISLTLLVNLSKIKSKVNGNKNGNGGIIIINYIILMQ